jgi:putative nucleotidyltransferase with HDIG domain
VASLFGCGRIICKNLNPKENRHIPKDLAFTSGLLHDIGKVILAQFFPAKILEIKQELKTSKLSFTEVERKYFGYDHQEVGMKALETWNFPEELKEVVAYHHNPELAVKFPKLVAMVHIANQISVISGIGIDIGGISHELSAQAVKILGITEADIESYYYQFLRFKSQLLTYNPFSSGLSMNIALIGPRGVGKSKVSRKLSKLLSMPVLSTDMIAVYELGGISIPDQIKKDNGKWNNFRKLKCKF